MLVDYLFYRMVLTFIACVVLVYFFVFLGGCRVIYVMYEEVVGKGLEDVMAGRNFSS